MKIIKYLLIYILFFSIYIWNVKANINFSVSPITYSIDTHTGAVIFKTASLRNNSNRTATIVTWKTDFQANWSTWKPDFVRKSELVYPDQELSTWITIEIDQFEIWPKEKKEVNFAIQVPNNATPWWHYWAVCFKDANSNSTNGWNISINIDYCIIILVNVDWEIITKAEVETTKIKTKSSWNWGWWWWWYSNKEKDDCIVDLTKSKYDWNCISEFFEKEDFEDSIADLKLDEDSNTTLDDFVINFETLFINEWNTHLLPEWKIKLVDKNWNQIKWIWKETIKNEHWAKVWEKIVDYLPINDEWWNVLPSQKRIYDIEWKWFPYEWYDENWKNIIKYWSPEEYYTKINIDKRWYIFPWERENERINHEKIKAYIDISYINNDWDTIEYSSAQEFYVDYKEKYIWLNPYAFIIIILIIILLLILWLIFRKKKIICINKECGKKLDKDMKVCPYCETKQNKKIIKAIKEIICINKKCSKKLDNDMKICPYCETKQNKKIIKAEEKKVKNKNKKDKKK